MAVFIFPDGSKLL